MEETSHTTEDGHRRYGNQAERDGDDADARYAKLAAAARAQGDQLSQMKAEVDRLSARLLSGGQPSNAAAPAPAPAPAPVVEPADVAMSDPAAPHVAEPTDPFTGELAEAIEAVDGPVADHRRPDGTALRRAEEEAAAVRADADDYAARIRAEVDGLRRQAEAEVEAFRVETMNHAEFVRRDAEDEIERMHEEAEQAIRRIHQVASDELAGRMESVRTAEHEALEGLVVAADHVGRALEHFVARTGSLTAEPDIDLTSEPRQEHSDNRVPFAPMTTTEDGPRSATNGSTAAASQDSPFG